MHGIDGERLDKLMRSLLPTLPLSVIYSEQYLSPLIQEALIKLKAPAEMQDNSESKLQDAETRHTETRQEISSIRAVSFPTLFSGTSQYHSPAEVKTNINNTSVQSTSASSSLSTSSASNIPPHEPIVSSINSNIGAAKN